MQVILKIPAVLLECKNGHRWYYKGRNKVANCGKCHTQMSVKKHTVEEEKK